MSKPEFFVTPGYGERNLKLFHYSQAVKIGNRLELSGQGGWNDDWEFPSRSRRRSLRRSAASSGPWLSPARAGST